MPTEQAPLTPDRRSARRPLKLLLLAALLFSVASSTQGTGRQGTEDPQAEVLAAGRSALTIREPGYRLIADPFSAMVTVTNLAGAEYNSFPLIALCGSERLPPGSVRSLVLNAGHLVSTVISASGSPIEKAVLSPSAYSFQVSFQCAPGHLGGRSPVFFADGHQGLAPEQGAFAPDAQVTAGNASAGVSGVGRRPFAPPPFDIELRGAAGWMGMGLVQVPDATAMQLAPAGGISIDYPLTQLASWPDQGAGGLQASMVGFPSFVATFGSDPYRALEAYDRALIEKGAAPDLTLAQHKPAWWLRPMVDTWGEQLAQRAARGSSKFTASWVANFVRRWRHRFGVRTFTLVVDSRWQSAIGSAEPDQVRFGGDTGMRDLIDQMHRQGIRVMLWWPLWIQYPFGLPPSDRQLDSLALTSYVDPTSPDFGAQTMATIRQLLGSGSGELNADGLKLDWGYDLPPTFQNPALGVGMAALYRYLATLHTDAHLVRPDALIDSSAVAPQFGAVTDSIRLYDGWTNAQWAERAAIVSAVDAGALIDGDGWEAGPDTIIKHTVASTVYGTPAIYFADRWATGRRLPAQLADTLGDVVGLSALKGRGRAIALSNGDWKYLSDGHMTAESIDSNRALAVWTYSGCVARGKVVSTVPGQLSVPLPRGGWRQLDAQAGVTYVIRWSLPDCVRSRVES